MASDEGLSRDESRQMRDIGRQAMSQVVGVALKQAVSHDLLRTFAVVSKVNGDGTVDLECGSEETPMPLNGVRLTLGCSTVEVGDTVVVDTYDHSPLIVSVLYSNASSGHTVASKPAVDRANEAAASAKEASEAALEETRDLVTLRIDSSRGTVFKNSEVSTVLTVRCYKRGRELKTLAELRDAMGDQTVRIRWWVLRAGDADWVALSDSDPKLSSDGTTLTLRPSDIDVKCTFKAEVVSD